MKNDQKSWWHCNPVQGSTKPHREIPAMRTGNGFAVTVICNFLIWVSYWKKMLQRSKISLPKMVKFPNVIINIRSMCTLSLKVHLEIHVVRLTPTSATSHFKTWTWNFMPRGFDHWFWNPKWFLSCSWSETPPILNLRILIFFFMNINVSVLSF